MSSYAARNTGIQEARGEIIAFTDADCIADENWLRELVAPFADPQVGGVGGQVLDYPPANMVESFLCSLKPFSRYQTDDVFLPVLLTVNTAYRKAHLLAVGLLNQNLFTAADVDLAWRVQLRTGAKVVYAAQAIVHHKHRATLKGLFKQFRRHGFGEILLDAMYKDHPGYQRTPARQLKRIGSQFLALMTYVCSFCYRLLVCKLKGKDRLYVITPVLWFIAEGANVWGKMKGMWVTRFFRLNPERRLWEDPGER
ncbi:MAG: glycosyltransferase [Anaerolineales bacterium]|nr:glycosyltransferase [Anaerolineales bacterium]